MTAATKCRHWIGSDATGHSCGADAAGALGFCAKHLELERRRVEKTLEKGRAKAARAEAAWREQNVPRLPSMRVQLEQAEAEYARRTAPRVADRAAYGGAMHPSVRKAQGSSLSDSNVARVVELERLMNRLRADIARAEAAV